MDFYYLGIALIALVLLAVISGMELAYVSSNRLHMGLQSKLGNLNGRILDGLIKNPTQFTGTILIGTIIAFAVYGVSMTNLLAPVFSELLPQGFDNQGTVLFLVVVCSALILLIVAEYIPMSLFKLHPSGLLAFLTVPFSVVHYLLFPLVWLVLNFTRLVMAKGLGLAYNEDRPALKVADLSEFIQNSLPTDTKEASVDIDQEIFDNAVEFKTVRIRDCMVPRTDIVAVEVDASIAELKKVFVESGHSKIIVYKDSIDDVIGYCHHLELFKKPKSIHDILTPIIIVPESALANELLVQFISERKSLAVVVDEFGGTGGIVSMEDIIEQIFGEIEDEYDKDNLVEQKISDQEYLLSARLEIDYLNEKYDWSFPSGDFETLAGLILSLAASIPKKGESVVIGPYTFTVMAKHDNRIDTVKLKINTLTYSK